MNQIPLTKSTPRSADAARCRLNNNSNCLPKPASSALVANPAWYASMSATKSATRAYLPRRSHAIAFKVIARRASGTRPRSKTGAPFTSGATRLVVMPLTSQRFTFSSTSATERPSTGGRSVKIEYKIPPSA